MVEVNYEKARIYTLINGEKNYVYSYNWSYKLTNEIKKATIYLKEGFEDYKSTCEYLNKKNKDLIFAIEEVL